MSTTATSESLAQTAAQIWLSTTTEFSRNDSQYFEGNETELSRFSRPLLTFAAIMTIAIMIVGICGNLLTIFALLKCPKVRNVAAAFIICLCVADCLFCMIVLPFNAFRFIRGTWTHGEILCRVIPFIQYGSVGVSLLCIAMITINRYIMIAHHSAYARIYKRQWIGAMIGFCWLFSYGMQLPTFFKVWGAFGYDPNLGTCSILKDANGRSSKTALFIIAFIIPCLVIICCYARIFWVVHKSEVRLRRHATKQNSIPNNLRQVPPTASAASRISSPVSSSSFDATSGVDTNKNSTGSAGGGGNRSIRIKDQRDVKARRNEWRITKMVLAIFLSFVMCYLPITVIKVADKNVQMPGFHIFGYIMVYLAACINPIIYVIMNKQYRQAYKTVLMCKPTRLLPFSNAGSSVGEKWKDIGYSYNHSRTMVSQISIADYNSNPQQVMGEQQNNTNINQQNWLQDIDTNIIPTISHTNTIVNNNSHHHHHHQLESQPQQSFQQQMQQLQRNIHRPNIVQQISLIQDDDVIMEEDEDEEEVEEVVEQQKEMTKQMDTEMIKDQISNITDQILYNQQMQYLKDIPDNNNTKAN